MKKLKITLVVILVYAISAGLAYLLAPIGGSIHSFLTGDRCTGGLFLLESRNGCFLEGFVYFYIFVLTVLLFSFLKQKTAWISFIIGSIAFWSMAILMISTEGIKSRQPENIGTLVIMLAAFVLGYILAFGIRKLKGKHNTEQESELKK